MAMRKVEQRSARAGESGKCWYWLGAWSIIHWLAIDFINMRTEAISGSWQINFGERVCVRAFVIIALNAVNLFGSGVAKRAKYP